MPDIFVAPDEPKTENPHKRVPEKVIIKPEAVLPKQEPVVKLEPYKEKTEPVAKKNTENFNYNKENKNHYEEETDLNDVDRNSGIPLFASYWKNPKGVYFDTQEPNENIILFLRKHFITNFQWVLGLIFFLLIPLVIPVGLSYFRYSLNYVALETTIAIVSVYYLFVLNYGFNRFLDWYYNISLITKERILDVEFSNLISKKIAATKISLVQDVTYKQTGVIRSMFNYGDVLVQTAGTQDNFLLHAVPRPEAVVNILESLIGKGRGNESV